jgi:TonB family protein
VSPTQIPPTRGTQAAGRESVELYDARYWESAYRDIDAPPALLLQLQDDLDHARRREAFWISVVVHLLVVLAIVNFDKLAKLLPHQAAIVRPQGLPQGKDLTFLELPPDAQKITKRPDSNIISDKDRIATSKAPQLDRKELKRILDASRPGPPGPTAPPGPAEQPSPPAQAAAQSSPQPAAPPPPANQVAKLQSPQPAVNPFDNKVLSPGSQIAQATRAAAASRGGYSGGGGDYGLGQGNRGKVMGPMDILSDTMGVDFGPYLARVLHVVKMNWDTLIPESVYMGKKGKVAIEFAIMKDGRVAGLRYEQGGSSGDVALDRAAYGSITMSDPFPPLPDEFKGQYLALRFHYFYNPDKGDFE